MCLTITIRFHSTRIAFLDMGRHLFFWLVTPAKSAKSFFASQKAFTEAFTHRKKDFTIHHANAHPDRGLVESLLYLDLSLIAR